MQSLFRKLLFAAVVSAALPAVGQEIVSESPAVPDAGSSVVEETPDLTDVLVRLDERIDCLVLELNRITWECYFEFAEQGRITPDIMDYPGLNYRTLCDTVPAIDSLGKCLKAASDAYTDVLRSDPEYKSIHKEYTALKGVKDSKRKDENKGRYNLMYERLRKNNAAYTPALERRREAERQRNMCILRYLVEYHRSAGRVMPTDPLFRPFSETMRALQSRCPDIARLNEELSVLRKLRNEVFERQQREAFGVPKTEPTTLPKRR